MRGVDKSEKTDQLLLPALERPNGENGGSRIKIPKFSEHDLTNLVKKFHSQDPRTRKWLRIDSHGQAEVVEVPAPTPTAQASPTSLCPEGQLQTCSRHQVLMNAWNIDCPRLYRRPAVAEVLATHIPARCTPADEYITTGAWGCRDMQCYDASCAEPR